MDSATSFSGDLPAWMIGDLQPAATEVLMWLRSRVPRLSASNRFEIYKRLIDDSLGAPITLWLQPKHQEAFRSVMEMYYVTRALSADVAVPRTTLQRLVGGAVGQSTSPPATPWNLQFELFAHALLRIAGFAEVQVAEPDLLIPAGDVNIAFPVKRIVSPNPDKLRKRLSEAVAQAQRHGHRGLVVLAFDPPVGVDDPLDTQTFSRLATSLRAEVASLGAAALGFLFISLGLAPGAIFTTELTPEEADAATMLEGHAQVALHFGTVPEHEHPALFSWLSARGRQLMSGLVAEHAKLRLHWAGP